MALVAVGLQDIQEMAKKKKRTTNKQTNKTTLEIPVLREQGASLEDRL